MLPQNFTIFHRLRGVDWIELARDWDTRGGLLWFRQWTFGFHKIWKISRLAEELLASQERFLYMYFFPDENSTDCQ